MSMSTSGSQEGSVSQPGMRGSGQLNFPRQSCHFCGNYHSRSCYKAIGACFGCGQPGHLKKDCPYLKGAFRQVFTPPAVPTPSYSALSPGGSSGPAGRGSGRGVGGRGPGGRGSGKGQPRVFALTRQDAQASNVMVAGTLHVCFFNAYVLFDPGSTHSYVSPCFASRFGKQPVMLDHSFWVNTPIGETLNV